MIIYPTMQLSKGCCVSLEAGRLDAPSMWHVDPVETARSWAGAGAQWMHLTDLDWVNGQSGNEDLIRLILRAVGIPVQLAGGFRTADSVAKWIDHGAGRIVLSTLAVLDPQSVKALAKQFPDQIVLSVDVLNGAVMTDGWRTQSSWAPQDLIRSFNDAPLAGIVVTDIAADQSASDAQLGLISGLAASARAPVIASGVVHSLDDVSRLKYGPNIAGVLVGRALFRRTLALQDALDIARPEAQRVAEFQ